LAILTFGVWAVFKARKAGLLTWSEACVLLAGIIAYQVQNFFAFDTITANIAFFIFTGFSAYLWDASAEEVPQMARFTVPVWLSLGVGAGLYVLAAYSFFLTVWSPYIISKDINYGLNIGLRDPQWALSFFDDAKARPFVFDKGDLATKYSDFIATLSLAGDPQISHNQLGSEINDAFNMMKQATLKTKNEPINWYTLTNMYMVKANFEHTTLPKEATDAAQAGVNLVPDRIQNLYYLAQVKLQTDPQGALDILKKCVQLAPNIPDTSWWLALGLRQVGDLQDAAQAAEIAVSKGYQFKSSTEMQWLINYYADQAKNYPKVLALYEQAVKLDPNNFQLYANLAAAYAQVGDKPDAIAAAQKVIQLNPAAAPNAQAFIQSLK